MQPHDTQYYTHTEYGEWVYGGYFNRTMGQVPVVIEHTHDARAQRRKRSYIGMHVYWGRDTQLVGYTEGIVDLGPYTPGHGTDRKVRTMKVRKGNSKPKAKK